MAAITAGVIAAGGAAYAASRSSRAAKRAGQLQAGSAQSALTEQRRQFDIGRADLHRALNFGRGALSPFVELGRGAGNDLRNFLDPENQMAFLQNNPLFEAALGDVQGRSSNFAASRGRLNTGGFREELFNNFLATANPLIQQRLGTLLDVTALGGNAAVNQANLGANIAGGQANLAGNAAAGASNLLTQQGNAQAAGLIGSTNAQNAGLQQGIGALTGPLLEYFQSEGSGADAAINAAINEDFSNFQG